jgi:ATP-dependent protease ClpP protease subunit
MVDAPNASQAEQQKPNTTYVSFSAEINTNTTESLIATLSNLANQKISTVHLLISTPGGGVTQGINLYNVMRALPFKLITHNVGNVDSIGNAVFLAGVERYACPHSTFMFHGVGFDITTAMRLEEKTLKEKLDLVNIEHNRIGSIIEEPRNSTKNRSLNCSSKPKPKTLHTPLAAGLFTKSETLRFPLAVP